MGQPEGRECWSGKGRLKAEMMMVRLRWFLRPDWTSCVRVFRILKKSIVSIVSLVPV